VVGVVELQEKLLAVVVVLLVGVGRVLLMEERFLRFS
jgi:hypothetical protein